MESNLGRGPLDVKPASLFWLLVVEFNLFRYGLTCLQIHHRQGQDIRAVFRLGQVQLELSTFPVLVPCLVEGEGDLRLGFTEECWAPPPPLLMPDTGRYAVVRLPKAVRRESIDLVVEWYDFSSVGAPRPRDDLLATTSKPNCPLVIINGRC